MATKVTDMARITADGDYYVEGLIAGRNYIIGLFYTSGTGTLAIAQRQGDVMTPNVIYNNAATPVALTITASTPRFYEVKMCGDRFYLTVSSASSLIAHLRVFPVGHGY